MPKSIRPEGVFRKRVRAFSREIDSIHEGDVAALHRARVASRRLRELLPILRLDRDEAVKMARRLRRVTKRLGTVRELDVLMRAIRELAGKPGYPRLALREVDAAVAASRSSARARLASKLPLAKLKRLARRLERAVRASHAKHARSARGAMPDSKQAWVWALDARSVRRAASLKSLIDATGAVYVPEQLHQVRIAVKKLRYAEELRAEARSLQTSDVAILRSAQDLLGHLHDLEMLVERAREVQSSLSSSNLMASHRVGLLVCALEADCRRWHARYMGERAKLVGIAVRIAKTTARPGRILDRAAG